MPQGYEVKNANGERAWWDGKKLTPLDANGMQAPKARTLSGQEQMQLSEARQGAESARDLARSANVFTDLNKKSGTGAINKIPLVSEVRSMFDPNIAQMEALTARMAPQQRVPGSGTTSDRDLALYLQAVPSVDRAGNANAQITKDITQLSTRRAARAAYLDRWAQKNGTLLGADKAFADFWTTYSQGGKGAGGASNPFSKSGGAQTKSTVIEYDAQGNQIK